MASKRLVWLSLVLMLSVACAQAEVMSIIKDKEGVRNHVGAACSHNDTSNYIQRGDNDNARAREIQSNKHANHDDVEYQSVLGDAGMKDDRVRVALESWNFCNRVGNEGGQSMPSPRYADCTQIVCNSSASSSLQQDQRASCEAQYLVKNSDNDLKSGQAFPQGDFVDSPQPDVYAVQKELYLASLCETMSDASPWHFWMIMLKNGNFDVNSGLCPSTAPSSRPLTSQKAQLRRHKGSSSPADPSPRMVQISSCSNEVGSPSLRIPRQTNKEITSTTGGADITTPSLVQVSHISTDAKDVSHQAVHPAPLAAAKGSFPCFGAGCMNHPRIYHKVSTIQGYACANTSDAAGCGFESSPSLSGSFYGTYDLDDNGLANGTISPNISYFSVDWSKDAQSGTWFFHHVLTVNHKYPWLMLYLRADATRGFSGGYPWETRGMMMKVPESPDFMAKLTLEVLRGGGSASQFYLLDIGGCWKNDGSACDGNTSSDVTRYSEMIINPDTTNFCNRNAIANCPPYHVDAKTKQHIQRNDTARFPYTAYHYYCVPPNAQFAEKPYSVCDPYSNPQPQEIMQLLPHPEWAVHGYPSSKGQGWVGDPRTWTLDVGGLSQRLYFYQDPNTRPAPRKWTSVDVGTEIFISRQTETAEWILSDFDVLSTLFNCKEVVLQPSHNYTNMLLTSSCKGSLLCIHYWHVGH